MYKYELRHTYLLRKYGPHNIDTYNILIGNLLGDAFCRKNKNKKGTIFIIAQGEKNKEYIYYLYDLYKSINLVYIDKEPKFKQYKNFNKYVFYTITHSTLDIFYDYFYKEKDGKYIKGLYNKKFIYDYFNELSLALWIMDDGTIQNGHIKICTDNFIKEDIIFLQSLLLNKYNLKTTLHKASNKSNKKDDQYRIYFKAESMPLLISLIYPHFTKSMLYKLGTKFLDRGIELYNTKLNS